MQRLLLLALFIGGSLFLQAQRFGGHPPSTRWKQINTDTVKVIFPEGYEQKAADIASITHQLGQQTQPTMGSRMLKITIVLQPNTIISNAYVSLAPRRSELQLTPEQNSFELGSIQWYRFLTFHEYRHVQQYNNFKKGFSRIAFYLFGEDGQELANNAAIPNWFWEGDAVYQETRMSGQGRGRLPFFFNDYRSLWMAHKNYSWQKLRSGSLRDFTPDHYRLGYMMVSYGREKYGDDFWKKVTDDAARYKGFFYPWQHAVKKYACITYNQFRENAMQYFHSFLPADNKADPAAAWAEQQKHFVGDDEFPQWIDDHTLVMVKSSYRTIPAFYKHDLITGADTRIRVRDISIDNYFSYRNGKIVYAAYVPDTRWTWVDYSVLKLLDLETGIEKTLSSRSKFFSPDISSDGNRIVAVNVQPASDAKLDILSSESGSLIKEVPNPNHLFYTYPKFYDNNTIVSAVRNANGAMTMGMINSNDGSMEELLPWSMNVIGFPNVSGDTITFTASHNGNDILFALIDKKLYRLQSADTGLINGKYQWTCRNNTAIWTSYTAVGYHLMKEQVSSTSFIPVTPEYFTSTLFSYNFPDLQTARNIPVSSDSYPVSKYSQSFGLLNFHSWHPFINDPDYTFSLLGENVLNTLQSEIFFNYNRNEQSKQIGANFTYGALFPWITLGSNYTIDRNAPFRNTIVFWNEWQSSAGLSIPLNLSSGRNSRSLTFGSSLVYNKRYFQGIYKDTFDSRGFSYLNSQVSFTNQSQQARLHIYPRWAQSITLRYSNAISLFTANQFLASAYWYFPGVGLTNNLIINTAFQQRDTLNNARFSNSFPFSRGYVGENFHRMTKIGVNYHLPLLYPDQGIANIVYFLRVRANMFYDYTHVFDYTFPSRNEYRDEFRSYGVELFFDTQWWNEYPVSFGIRYSRLVDGQKQGLAPDQWEFILPMNLFSR